MLRTFEGRSLPISMAIHGAAVGALILTSALLPEPFPETVVRASTPVAFPMETRKRPANIPAVRSSAARPPAAHPLAASSHPPVSTREMPGIRVLPDETNSSPAGGPVDFDGTESGGCERGCVVSGGEPSGKGEDGDGTGDPPVVRVGGIVRPPQQVLHAPPEYPELARRVRITGSVVLDCLIDESGRVREVSVLRGHPLLAPAAVAAVERWVYAPSLLNGVPVQVLMTVTVRFDLK